MRPRRMTARASPASNRASRYKVPPDINERFSLEIDEESYTTLGGYMLGRLGRRPKIGDVIEVGGRTLRVEAVDGLRVSRVRII